jgi:hypothetical protein
LEITYFTPTLLLKNLGNTYSGGILEILGNLCVGQHINEMRIMNFFFPNIVVKTEFLKVPRNVKLFFFKIGFDKM